MESTRERNRARDLDRTHIFIEQGTSVSPAQGSNRLYGTWANICIAPFPNTYCDHPDYLSQIWFMNTFWNNLTWSNQQQQQQHRSVLIIIQTCSILFYKYTQSYYLYCNFQIVQTCTFWIFEYQHGPICTTASWIFWHWHTQSEMPPKAK